MIEFTKEEFFNPKCHCYQDVAKIKSLKKEKNFLTFLKQKKWITMLIGCTSLMIAVDLIFIMNFITIAQVYMW